jgi:hypothetical protein
LLLILYFSIFLSTFRKSMCEFLTSECLRVFLFAENMPAKRKSSAQAAEATNVDPCLVKKHRADRAAWADAIDSTTSSKNQKVESDEHQTRILVTRATGFPYLFSAPTRSLPPELSDEKFVAEFPANDNLDAVLRVFAFLKQGTFHDDNETGQWTSGAKKDREKMRYLHYKASPCIQVAGPPAPPPAGVYEAGPSLIMVFGGKFAQAQKPIRPY